MYTLVMRLSNFYYSSKPWSLSDTVGLLFFVGAFLMMFFARMFGMMLLFLYLSAFSYQQASKISLFFKEFWGEVLVADDYKRIPFAVEVRTTVFFLWVVAFVYTMFWETVLIQTLYFPDILLVHTFILATCFSAWGVDGLMRREYINARRLRARLRHSVCPDVASLKDEWRDSKYHFSGKDYWKTFWQVSAVGFVIFLIHFGSDFFSVLTELQSAVSMFHAEQMNGWSLRSDYKETIPYIYPNTAIYFETWDLLGQAKDKIVRTWLSDLVRPYY